jgi:hypothetical protein
MRDQLALTPGNGPVPVLPMYRGRRQSPKPVQQQAERLPQHTPWGAIDEALHTLQAQGIPVATIARQLGISRPTVYAYLRGDTPPAPRRPHRRCKVTPQKRQRQRRVIAVAARTN